MNLKKIGEPVNLRDFLSRQTNTYCRSAVGDAGDLACTRNREDVIALAEQPTQGDRVR